MDARRYLAVIQDPRGYPPLGAPPEPVPPHGPAPPTIESVVLADDYDRLQEVIARAARLCEGRDTAMVLQVLREGLERG